MISLSHTTGYAIHALCYLEFQRGQTHRLEEVARATGVPLPYLGKIMNQLARQGLVKAKRGYRGGVTLVRPAAEVSLLEIVEAVEGTHWIGDCLLGMKECAAAQVCPTRHMWQRVRRDIESALRTHTLADMAKVARAQGWRTARRAGTPPPPVPDAGKRGVRTAGEARVEPGLGSRSPARARRPAQGATASAGQPDFGGGRIPGCAAPANHLKVAAPGRRSEGNRIPRTEEERARPT